MYKAKYQIICLSPDGLFDSVIQGVYDHAEAEEVVEILKNEDRVMMNPEYKYRLVLFFDSKYPLAK